LLNCSSQPSQELGIDDVVERAGVLSRRKSSNAISACTANLNG
jgi:hypothetical protein